jgi:hypothetical protein
MTVVSSMVMAVVLVAQAPPPADARERHTIVIEYLGSWGLVDACPGDGGFDRLTGEVKRVMRGDLVSVPVAADPPQSTSTQPPAGTELAATVAGAAERLASRGCVGVPCQGEQPVEPPDEDGDSQLVYSGILTRETAVTLCEEKDTAAGSELCVGRQNGRGSVRVTITIDPGDGGGGNVLLEPLPDTTATVSGKCDTLDNAAEVARYKRRDQIQFETLPAGALVTGATYKQSLSFHSSGKPEYTLKVDTQEGPPAPRR